MKQQATARMPSEGGGLGPPKGAVPPPGQQQPDWGSNPPLVEPQARGKSAGAPGGPFGGNYSLF